MHGNSVIPECRSSRCPLETNLDVDVLLVNIIQVIKYDIALSFIQPYYTLRHGSIDEERLPPSRWVYANDRMDSLDMFWAGVRVIAVEVCVSAHIGSFLSIDYLSEIWA